MECMEGTGRGAGSVSGRFARARSERVQPFRRGSSGCRSQRNEFEPGEPVGCQFGGGKPFQSTARRRRSRRGDAVWSPIPELCTVGRRPELAIDRKSTRLNSSHVEISYAVFCLKKKKK